MPLRPIRALLGALLCLNGAVAGDLPSFAVKCVQARAKTSPVRILQFGDSHLASAGVQRMFRQIFQAQFGDGGAGFGLPWVKPEPGVTAQASNGWHRSPKTMDGASAGLASAWIETVRQGETARIEAACSRVRIHFLACPGGGAARIVADGQPLGEISLQSDAPTVMVFDRELTSRNAHRLDIVTSNAGTVRILGVSLEQRTGAVHSVIAANGRQANWMLEIPESIFSAQVRAEAPDLVILAFGTNEANERIFDAVAYRNSLETLLDRFQKAAPGVAFTLVGPPDANLPRSVPGALEQVIEVQRALAERHGAYFWDQREAMGGPGSMLEWNRQGQAAHDQVHFTPDGYQRLGQMFLGHFFAYLEQLCESDPARGILQQDPGWRRAARGAFTMAPLPLRMASATTGIAPPPMSGTQGHPIYVFKTVDGRTIITDDPSTVANEQGEWVGRKPE